MRPLQMTSRLIRWIRRSRLVNKNDSAADANQQAQMDFYNTLTQNYSTDYSQFEGAEKNLMSKLDPIVNAGPGQYGYDATQDAAIRGAAIESDAAAAHDAQQAVNQQITASNGGAALMPTGAQDQLREEGDVAAAQKLSSDLNTITQEGYKQGTQNWQTALDAEGTTIGMMNPNAFAGSATGGGNSATGAVNGATNAAAASDSWMGLVGGALGGATGTLTSWGLNRKPSTGSSFGIPPSQAPYGPNSD